MKVAANAALQGAERTKEMVALAGRSNYVNAEVNTIHQNAIYIQTCSLQALYMKMPYTYRNCRFFGRVNGCSAVLCVCVCVCVCVRVCASV